MLSQKIEAEKWGAKVIEQISIDLQKQLPGLKGFSYRNLMKMKQFYSDCRPLLILPSAKAALANMNCLLYQCTKNDIEKKVDAHIIIKNRGIMLSFTENCPLLFLYITPNKVV